MTLIRKRRQQEALRLSLPGPVPRADFRHYVSTSSSSPLSSTSSNSAPGIIDSLADLEKLAVIGHGNGGTVYKVRHKNNSSTIYALKILRFHENAMKIQQQAAQEAEILKRVDSQFIVKCYGVFDSEFADINTCCGDLCFVMEYMEAGSLLDVLSSCHTLPEKLISRVAKRVLQGLNYLHGIQIVHRDIKPSNLLINGRGEIKIADFGVSRLVARSSEECESYVGTWAYMSPERFDPERWNGDGCNGFAGDVWSLGVVVLECLVGRFPLIDPGQKLDWATLMCAICFGEKRDLPETASPEFRSFVMRCLEKDWRSRGTVEELLNHPFVSECEGGCIQELTGYASNS